MSGGLFKKDELEIIRRDDIDLRDESNPNSVISLVPSNVANAMKAIPVETFGLPENDLALAGNVDIVEKRLRHSFWLEYGQALMGKRRMNMAQVYMAVCPREYFQKVVLTNSYKLAYVLTPPADYRVQMAEILTLGLQQIREILSLPHEFAHPKSGEPMVDAKLAGVKARIVEDLMTRSHGHPLRNIEITSKNMNVNVDMSQEIEATRDVAEIDAKIKELESQLKAIDVKATSKRSNKLVE